MSPERPRTHSLPEGQFQPGGVYRRKEIHDRWGGQRYGGISTPARADYAFLFTGEPGSAFGYEDDWLDDETFAYTGEGQEGDMELVRGNLAIVSRSPDIHLFKILGDGLVRYLHQMFYATHEFRTGKDKTHRDRRIVVLRLRKYTPKYLQEAMEAKRRALGSAA